MQHAVVSSKELGTNCWLPRRFIEGCRCPRVMSCGYPEKKTCKAVDAEIVHLHQSLWAVNRQVRTKISELAASRRRCHKMSDSSD